MHVDILLLKILFLFFPGIIAYYIIEMFTEVKSKNSLYHVLNIFVLGVMSYSLTYVIYKFINVLLHLVNFKITTRFLNLSLNLSEYSIKTNFINCLFSQRNNISFVNIVITTVIAILLGVLITYIIQNGLLHKWAQKYGISKKFSDSTVWGYVFNSDSISPWITVRDIKNDLMFQGRLVAFSAENKNNELFLSDVDVYKNSTAELFYRVYGLYITRPENEITIEFYKPEEENNE